MARKTVPVQRGMRVIFSLSNTDDMGKILLNKVEVCVNSLGNPGSQVDVTPLLKAGDNNVDVEAYQLVNDPAAKWSQTHTLTVFDANGKKIDAMTIDITDGGKTPFTGRQGLWEYNYSLT